MTHSKPAPSSPNCQSLTLFLSPKPKQEYTTVCPSLPFPIRRITAHGLPVPLNSSLPLMNRSLTDVKWLSDILLLDSRYNETTFNVVSSLFPLELSTVPLIVVHGLGTIVNVFLLTVMLMEKSKQKLKIKILLASITLTHLFWSFTWLCISLTPAIFSDEMQNSYRISLNNPEEVELRALIWELVGRQAVDNLYFTILIFFLAISLERYLNLLPSYVPNSRGTCCRFLMIVVPWLLAYTLFDHRLIALLIPMESAVFCRLCLLIIPTILSFLFSLISCLRPARKFEAFSSLNSQLPIVQFFFSILGVATNSALFFRLLGTNFEFVIIMGSEYEDHLLSTFLDCWYWISTWLIHLWALLFALSLIVFVKIYREMTKIALGRLCCCCCWTRTASSSQETLRSIIGSRNLISTIH